MFQVVWLTKDNNRHVDVFIPADADRDGFTGVVHTCANPYRMSVEFAEIVHGCGMFVASHDQIQ